VIPVTWASKKKVNGRGKNLSNGYPGARGRAKHASLRHPTIMERVRIWTNKRIQGRGRARNRSDRRGHGIQTGKLAVGKEKLTYKRAHTPSKIRGSASDGFDAHSEKIPVRGGPRNRATTAPEFKQRKKRRQSKTSTPDKHKGATQPFAPLRRVPGDFLPGDTGLKSCGACRGPRTLRLLDCRGGERDTGSLESGG